MERRRRWRTVKKGRNGSRTEMKKALERRTVEGVWERREGGRAGGEEGDYLSPINAMMSAVMSAAGTINGEDADPDR